MLQLLAALQQHWQAQSSKGHFCSHSSSQSSRWVQWFPPNWSRAAVHATLQIPSQPFTHISAIARSAIQTSWCCSLGQWLHHSQNSGGYRTAACPLSESWLITHNFHKGQEDQGSSYLNTGKAIRFGSSSFNLYLFNRSCHLQSEQGS